ncbi:MAG: tetratricopeptide repeat protein [Peptostreptococcaceae bacterium]
MKNTKFSINRIKNIPNDPKVYHTKGAFYEKLGKVDSAIESYKIAADLNYVKSQYVLGNIYLNRGKYTEAEEWYSRAFRNGMLDAAFDLGNMYYDIDSYEYCIYWYEKLAREGQLQSQNNLGVCHFKLKDFYRSEKWLKEAASGNLGKACFNLGVLYTNLNRPEDALEFYKKGSVLLDESSKYNLAIISEDEKNAISLYKYLHKMGHIEGCFNLGLIMEKNNNLEEAERYYIKSADKGHAKSQYRLAYIYDRQEKINEAITYYEKAIEQNHTMAKYRLGNLYNKDNNLENAIKYYEMAAEDNLVPAKNNLAGVYFEKEELESAIKFYEEAIVDGCRDALENIGDLYYKNEDKEKAASYYLRNSEVLSCQIKLGNIYDELENVDETIIWYTKASENGDAVASYKLGCIYYNLKDIENSKKYFEIAVSKNIINARIHLGQIYFNEENYEEAKKMFEVAANEENTYSQHMLGVIYDIYYRDYINSKYWYEKARAVDCIESIYNLGHLSLKLNEDSEAEKYYKEGMGLGCKKCEFMLAGLYYKKSIDMYTVLAEENYDSCKDILEKMPKLHTNFDEVLITQFALIEKEEVEEEYVPNYILDIEEDLDEMAEKSIDNMIIDRDDK